MAAAADQRININIVMGMNAKICGLSALYIKSHVRLRSIASVSLLCGQVYSELQDHLVETLISQAHVCPLPIDEAAVHWCALNSAETE